MIRQYVTFDRLPSGRHAASILLVQIRPDQRPGDRLQMTMTAFDLERLIAGFVAIRDDLQQLDRREELGPPAAANDTEAR
jgi:hypothetical protein